jgi:sugar O-acyltransferase (sialic acid O-acetyltransferase NeuD family)
MRELYIVGSGGCAKDVYFVAKATDAYDKYYFVDIEKKDPVKIGPVSIPVIAEEELAYKGKDTHVVIAIGNPVIVQKLSARFKGKFIFPNLIHPTVVGNFEDNVLGEGNIITANCVFTVSIKVGSFNQFNLGCTIAHDVVIGDANVINPCVNISGGVEIGNANLIGVNATILQYKKVGNNAVVGASSLVTKDVNDGITVVGIPAKQVS